MRTDAVAVILEVVARMRQLDPRLKVTWESGWERLGNGLAARYVGGIVHDTTTPSSPAKPFPTQTMLRVGRPDLSGPIANFGGPYCTVDAPWIHVTAAFPANHAGASGGRSMGPLPRTSLFNPTVLGLEIDFSGLALMPAGQMYVGKLWARAVADVLAGGNLEYVRAHFETSVTGKIDISYAPGKSYDMAAFRRDAANLQEDDVPAADVFAVRINTVDWDDSPISMTFGEWCAEMTKRTRPVNRGGSPVDQRQELADAKSNTIRLVDELLDQVTPASGTAGGRAPVPVDAAAVAAALAADGGFVKALATATAAEMDRRARDGDPATGPVS